MQVSQLERADSYAIIGGGKAREFKVATSAHAFRIMTDALYQDKPYAVARETICNATDAHIMGGCPERPIEITLTDTQFIVKDFGPGIADDMMEEIYLTLFGSTKTNDDKMTGGFGLGCKAPFSISDHFMVISCHKGIKNTYALTVGNEDTEGKPAAQLMHSGTTKETGLTVIVPIDEDIREKFDSAIQRTLINGGIKAIYNGDTDNGARDYTGIIEAGYGLFPNDGFLTSKVSILYGNVLYPLDKHEGTREVLDKLQYLLEPTDWKLVLYAPPSSVTPKPDRESLGYNEQTLETVNSIGWRAYHQILQLKTSTLREVFIGILEQNDVRRHHFATFMNDGLSCNTSRFVGYPTDSKPAIGAKAIARALAGEKIRNNHRYMHPKLNKIAAKFYRTDRASLFNDHEDNGGLSDQHRYNVRRLVRGIEPVLGKVPVLRFRAHNGQRIQKNAWSCWRSPDRNDYRFKPSVTVAPTVKFAETAGTVGYFLIGNFKPEQIAGMKAGAERMGFAFHVMAPQKTTIVRLKEEERAPSRFFDYIGDLYVHHTGARRHSDFYAFRDPELVDPTSFVAPCLRRKKITWSPKRAPNGIGPVQPETEMMVNGVPTTVLANIKNATKKNVTGIAVARSVEDRERLLVAGVKRYADKLINRAKAMIQHDSEEHAFISALVRAEHADTRYWDREDQSRSFACELAKLDRKVACAVFMQPYRPSKHLANMMELFVELRTFFQLSVHEAWLDKVEENAFLAAQKEYHALIRGFEQHLPRDLWAFFERLAKGRLRVTDTEHLKLLSKISQSTHFHYLEDTEKHQFTLLVEREAERFCTL